MMSLTTIRALSDQQARRAAREKRRPYVLFDAAEIDRMPPFPFPNLGSYRPRGWKLVEELFVDKSGCGADDEPALSCNQLLAKLRELEAGATKDGKTLGYALIEEGQFQVYIGVFEQRASARKRAS